MSGPHRRSPRQVLEPQEQISEVLFGLIMVLTFTGSLSVAEVGREDVRAMLVSALGCNIAWGLIDAVFYLMGSLAEKGRSLLLFRQVRGAEDPANAQGLIAETMPPVVASLLQPGEMESLHQRLKALPEPPPRPGLSRDDWRGALAVFFWVFVSTLPVVIPFVCTEDARLALRISNGVAIAMLFLAGHRFGRLSGRHAVRTGLAMVVLGGVLVGVTMALGG